MEEEVKYFKKFIMYIISLISVGFDETHINPGSFWNRYRYAYVPATAQVVMLWTMRGPERALGVNFDKSRKEIN